MKPQYIFVAFWFLINVFQAATTELTSDEGYYWFYASKLEWGYYDHPPLLALFIKIGGKLFNSELAIRFFNVILSSIGLIFLFKLLPKETLNKKWLYLVLLALPLFNYLTFIAFPDSPLIAFSIIFLYGYKRLLEKDDWLSVGIMIVSMTLMLYAKYHAVLVLPILILSNLKLLKNFKLYFIIVSVSILYIPHLLWQIDHDYPSFTYHLQGRSRPFKFDYLIQYITQQLAVFGPLIILPFLYKTVTLFERGLLFLIYGIFSFFLIMSVRGFVHLHWTSLAIFPVLILSILYVYKHHKSSLVYKICIPIVLIILVFRLYLSFHILPFNNLNVDYYHGRVLWAEDIEQVAKNRPVIFENQLREAPLYSYYSNNKLGIALYPWLGKKSQYEIWNYEDSIQGKDVMVVKRKSFPGCDTLRTRMGKEVYYTLLDKLNSFQNIRTTITSLLVHDNILDLKFELFNHRIISMDFNSEQQLFLRVIDTNEKAINLPIKKLNSSDSIAPKTFKEINTKLDLSSLNSGTYDAYIYINDGAFSNAIISKKIEFIKP